jgi:hypothetical protein
MSGMTMNPKIYGFAALLAVGLLGYFLYSINHSMERTAIFDAQSKCAAQSATFFNGSDRSKEVGATYKPLYSQKLNKCFTIIEAEVIEPDENKDGLLVRKKNKNLYDVFENQDLAFIKWDVKNAKWLCMARLTPGYTNFCDSPTSFDNLVNRYIH